MNPVVLSVPSRLSVIAVCLGIGLALSAWVMPAPAKADLLIENFGPAKCIYTSTGKVQNIVTRGEYDGCRASDRVTRQRMRSNSWLLRTAARCLKGIGVEKGSKSVGGKIKRGIPRRVRKPSALKKAARIRASGPKGGAKAKLVEYGIACGLGIIGI